MQRSSRAVPLYLDSSIARLLSLHTHTHTRTRRHRAFCVFDVNSRLPAFDGTRQMLSGLVSASMVFIMAANLLHWDVDYTELWNCLGLETPAPLSLSNASSPSYPYTSAWCVQSGGEGIPIGLGREIRAWGQRERGRGTKTQLT